MERTIYCSEPWFSLIREGRKPVEGRKCSPSWSGVSVGDVLVFQNGDESFRARVVKVNHYDAPDALQKYLQGEGLDRALPGVTSIEEGERIYLQWSTREEIDQYGMMGIQVQPV